MAARERERRRRATHRAESRENRRSKTKLRRRFKRYVLGGIVGLGGLIIVLSLVLPSGGGQISGAQGGGGSTSLDQGVQVAIQENEPLHIEVGQAHPGYSTAPPTSGSHYEIPIEEFEKVSWGAYVDPVEDELQVSYLEHGAIMVQYDCPEGCPDRVQQLGELVNRYPEGVMLAPYPNMNSTIVLTAWGWMDTFEDFDELRIDDFIQAHLGLGPLRFR